MENFLAGRAVAGDTSVSPQVTTEGFQSLDEVHNKTPEPIKNAEAPNQEEGVIPESQEIENAAPASEEIAQEETQVISNEADDHQVEIVSSNGQITKILVHCPNNKEIVINCEY